MTVLDFNRFLQDAKAGAAWPPGPYDFEVAEATPGKAGTSGNPMLKAKFRCLVGPYAGKHFSNNFNLTVDNPAALNIFFRQMAAFGLDENFFKQIGQTEDPIALLTPVAQNVLGKRVRINLEHRMWNGAAQNNLASIEPLTGGIASVAPNALAGMPPQPGATAPPPPPPQAAMVPPPPPAAAPITPPVPAAPPAAPQPDPAAMAAWQAQQAAAAAAAAQTPIPQVPPPPVQAAPTPPPPPVPAPPTPAPAPAPAPQPVPDPTPPPAPVTGAAPPPGYTQELWDSIPEEARGSILSSMGIVAPAAPAQPEPAMAGAIPPPPVLPV